MTVAGLLSDLLGPSVPIAFRAYDGSSFGPPDATTTVVFRSPDALRRIVTAPNELGFARAYVAGDFDVEGDIFGILALRQNLDGLHLRGRDAVRALRLLGLKTLRPLPPPPEEARLRGRQHSKARDAAAIAYHYDVSNAFYEIVLGPSLTYSCAVWSDDTATLEQAQASKHELVSRKLGLEPGMRLLDIGCGWGGMVLHAAREHGVHVVGVTLSRPQADLGARRVTEAGLDGCAEVRFGDYRDIDDGPYDAISSIGMFEHVGLAQLGVYFARCHELLRPGGRFLNHAISRPAHITLPKPSALRPRRLPAGFAERYVFPDGESHEVGAVVSAIQDAGLEARHVESLREHYPLTLRCWVRNLEAGWADAVREVGETRARIWRLYLAIAASLFEAGDDEIHQVLATKTERGHSGMPLWPEFS
jgi:cyclopropane-fatty-acyl-phospholipid synthase